MASTVPRLSDAHGRLVIGGLPKNPHEQALVVTGATSLIHRHDGTFFGVYVDNETPNRDHVAQVLAGMHAGTIVVGLYPNEDGHKIPGTICALEWFALWGSPPHADAYILWWDYVPPGERTPTMLERSRMLVQMGNRMPKELLVY